LTRRTAQKTPQRPAQSRAKAEAAANEPKATRTHAPENAREDRPTDQDTQREATAEPTTERHQNPQNTRPEKQTGTEGTRIATAHPKGEKERKKQENHLLKHSPIIVAMLHKCNSKMIKKLFKNNNLSKYHFIKLTT
jgi:hypothetical protein